MVAVPITNKSAIAGLEKLMEILGEKGLLTLDEIHKVREIQAQTTPDVIDGSNF